MNAERLLQHYEQIADAPDAIARLRRFILDLAVRGKLVPQDSGDEPASELLKRIESGRPQARGNQATVISGESRPFDLPKGWVWSTIGSICSKTGSGSTPRGGKEVYVDRGIPFLRSQNVYDDGLRLSDVARIAPEVHARMAGTAVKPSDLLLNITGGSMGRCSLVPESFGEANISQHVAIIRPVLTDMSVFIHGLVLSPYFRAFIFDEQTGAGRGGLPKNRMDQIAVALPPIAEQHRIVAKVDELMALCDALEAARTEQETKRDRLAAASLARLNAPDPETFHNDARFALDALPALTARPDQIKQLRQTILNLAARGKLVAQDPGDEPAAELLGRIVMEREAIVVARNIRGATPPSSPSADHGGFHLPSSWRLCSLGQITLITDPNPSHRYPDYSGGTIPILSTREFVGDDGWNPSTAKLTTQAFWEFQKEICAFSQGDIIFARKGRLGLPRFLPPFEKYTFSHTLFSIKPMSGLDPFYLLWLLRRDEVVTWLTNEMNQNTGVPTLGKAKTERLPFPLPPLAEQHRIVAKVDELMAICDQLETSLTSAAETRKKLLDALLAETLAPVDAEALREAAE